MASVHAVKMSSASIQEAQDLAVFASQTLERLSLALTRLDSADHEHVEERAWLEAATRRLSAAQASIQTALLGAAALPEFANTRKSKSEALANAWADAVESVFDGIVANVSGNGPLIEALFPHQRFDSLRRPGSAAQNFWLEFERRAESSYVRRLCGDREYQFLPPLLEAAKESERRLREMLSPKPLPSAEAAQLRERVNAASERLALARRQPRARGEAAFAGMPGVLGELGLDAKPRRRAPRSEPAKLAAS